MAWRLNGRRHAAWFCAKARFTPAPAWQQLAARFLSSWQVSSYGRLKRQNGTVTWGSKHGAGYLTAQIGGVQMYVHRLVMHTFHGPPQDRLAWQVNHLDGNKANNRLENLEYVTPKQNVHHSFLNPLRGTAGPQTSMPVQCKPGGRHFWKAYPSMTAAADALGTTTRSVAKSCAQGIVVKGYECQLASAMEYAIQGEEWKQMIDPKTGRLVPGRMVSSLGRLKGKAGRIFAGYRRKDGYCETGFRLNSEPRHRNVCIHQLVARAFLWPPPSPEHTPEHTQVNHKDGKKNHNSVGNLEYVTPAQNIAHSYRVTPRKTYSHVKPAESRPFGSSDPWRWHPSVGRAAKDLGVNRGCIGRCLAGRCKQTGGYEFRSLPPLPDLPGEQWLDVDLPSLLEERSARL